jgi:hypothetical protein
MPTDNVPVPDTRRKPGPPSRPVGQWVLGEQIFPGNGKDQRWRGYIQRDMSTVSTTYGESRK